MDFVLDFINSFLYSKTINFGRSGLSVIIEDNKDANSIGEGAFSIVYRGYDRQDTTNYYAIKKVYIQSKEYEKMVINEIKAFNKFKHSNILQLIDYHNDNDSNGKKVTYMLFPFIPNGSLRNVLTKIEEGSLRHPSLKFVLSNFRDICKALNVLHTFNPSYVHQDIKPENILIDVSGAPLLTDFGSVRQANITIDTRTDELRVIDQAAQYCTASYRAPELYDPKRGTTLDSRTDVWAMGCLLFAWWFGYSPFECEFYDSRIKVVECSSLRVLSNIPKKTNSTKDELIIYELVEWILEQDFYQRPFTVDIINRIDSIISSM